MIRIAKFLFAVGLGVFLHARFSAESKDLPSDRRSKSSIEEVKAGRAEQKNARRPKSIFESPEPPPRKEVVFHLEEGQVLNENQVYEEADQEITKILKQWKQVKGYEFGKGDFLCDVNEMCQIIINGKLHLYQEKK